MCNLGISTPLLYREIKDRLVIFCINGCAKWLGTSSLEGCGVRPSLEFGRKDIERERVDLNLIQLPPLK